MDLENIISSVFIIGIVILIINCYLHLKKIRFVAIGLLLIVLKFWLSVVLSYSGAPFLIISSILSTAFLGPLSYILFRRLLVGNVKNKHIVLHLLMPTVIVVVQFYNLVLAESENIMITIITNALIDLLNIIYVISSLFFIGKLNNLVPKPRKIIILLLFVTMQVFVLIVSLVSIISALYFTDDLDLVNLSVEVPKMFTAYYKLPLLIILTSSFGIFIYNEIKYLNGT